MKLDKKRVAVGMSGGVDSTACAYLLKEDGYNVIGITMKLLKDNDTKSEFEKSYIKDAKRICSILGIEHYILDVSEEFKSIVIENFISEYTNGRTPNPCIRCNKYIKYGKMMEFAFSKGAYYLATGHYAKIIEDKKDDIFRIISGKNKNKDQGYLLNQLNQDQLSHLLLPLGNYELKETVRKIALNVDKEISIKNDSVGICFIKNETYRDYLSRKVNNDEVAGNFIDINNNILGKHRGLYNYTIGQKRNLGLKFDREYYVVDLNLEENTVTLGDDKDTYSNGIIITNVNLVDNSFFEKNNIIDIKVCQWGYKLESKVRKIDENKYEIIFLKPERAISKGQYAVFYFDDEIIGGGYILEIIK